VPAVGTYRGNGISCVGLARCMFWRLRTLDDIMVVRTIEIATPCMVIPVLARTQPECVYAGQRNGNLHVLDFRLADSGGLDAGPRVNLGSPIVSARALSDGVRLVAACMDGKVMQIKSNPPESKRTVYSWGLGKTPRPSITCACSLGRMTTACGRRARWWSIAGTTTRQPAPTYASTNQSPCSSQVLANGWSLPGADWIGRNGMRSATALALPCVRARSDSHHRTASHAGGEDRSLRMWRVDTGAPLGVVRGFGEHLVPAAAFEFAWDWEWGSGTKHRAPPLLFAATANEMRAVGRWPLS
jgi:hypothetical protein